MDTPVSIPTWSELFGQPDNKEADDGRSINSPAAYLADLLRLLEDRFDPSDFRSRRPDITSGILLNGDQSFTAERQLDIANRVMSDRVKTQKGSPSDDVLEAAQHPLPLPFEYQHERIRQQLRLLRTQFRDLYAGFAPRPDIDVLARERLGLSPARAETIVRDLTHDAVGLSAAYGLAPDETLSSLEP